MCGRIHREPERDWRGHVQGFITTFSCENFLQGTVSPSYLPLGPPLLPQRENFGMKARLASNLLCTLAGLEFMILLPHPPK
jgi:hypothetical protein